MHTVPLFVLYLDLGCKSGGTMIGALEARPMNAREWVIRSVVRYR